MKIYVVDSERILRVSLADELRDAGFEVFEFVNANDALLQMNCVIPDLVITNLKMPDIDGIEFLKRIKKIDTGIFVVFMTAYSNISTAVEAIELGAYDFIKKPFDNEKIIISIRHIHELQQIMDENKELKIKLQQFYNYLSNTRKNT